MSAGERRVQYQLRHLIDEDYEIIETDGEKGHVLAQCFSHRDALQIIDALMQQDIAEYRYVCDPACVHRWEAANRLLEFCLECGGSRSRIAREEPGR